jgi:hypothetical protein
VQQVVGKANEGRNRQRRRVHWYRAAGEIGPTTQAGGRLSSDGLTRVPAVLERRDGIACLVFAESEDTLDTLLDNLIVAIDHVAPAGGVTWGAYEFLTEDKAEFATRVPVVQLEFALKLPVADEVRTLVEITGQEHTCTIETEL